MVKNFFGSINVEHQVGIYTIKLNWCTILLENETRTELAHI